MRKKIWTFILLMICALGIWIIFDLRMEYIGGIIFIAGLILIGWSWFSTGKLRRAPRSIIVLSFIGLLMTAYTNNTDGSGITGSERGYLFWGFFVGVISGWIAGGENRKKNSDSFDIEE